MAQLRILCLAMFAVIAVYTSITISLHGPNFIAPIFDLLRGFSWPAQFALDFATYLILSVVWILWRGRFEPPAILAAVCAGTFGMLFLAPYLVYLIGSSEGDPKKLLLGKQA